MKKFSFFASLALMAFALVPQTMVADDCQFIPDLFPGQDANRTATEVSATVKVGEWGPQSGYDGMHLINELKSSNPDVVVATSDNGYNAKVYFAAPGTADVTYKETIQRSTCTGVAQTIHYTVEKGTPTLYFAGQDGSAVTEYTAAWSQSSGGGDATGGGSSSGGEGGGVVTGGGVDGSGVVTGGGSSSGGDGGEGGGSYVWTPSYYARYQVLQNNGRGYSFVSTAIPVSELTFESSNPAVASISTSGQTTVNGMGSTVISVHWNGNENWAAADAQYTLNVKKAANLYFSPSLITDTIDNVRKISPVCPEGVTIDRWESMSPAVATVDNEGNVTLLKVGYVMIRAYFDGNDEYAPAVCACQINIVKRRPDIHFSKTYVEVEYGVTPYALPELIKPSDLNTSLYKWRLSNSNVASINTNTGALDIYGTGNVQVYYYSESNADPKYEPTSASYALKVTTSGVRVNGTLVTSTNPDVLGDGSMIYSVDPGVGKFLTFNNLNYVASGGTFIQADEPLNILVKGNCSISGANYAIQANSSVFVWCQNNKDSIYIDAQYVAIQAGNMKVHDCYLFATAGLYPIYSQTGISVSAGGYIFAEATGKNIGGKGTPEAIVANHFIKGEAAIGGIEVLTKGVTFVEGLGEPGTGGFFKADNSRATFVEIGKVPLPVKNDEVTDIDFETTDPHNNLDVVFSESKDDQFNESERQIEMNTATETKDVEDASAEYTTCSSGWLKALPGVLVFDLPAGKGEAEIECEIKAGSKLAVQIEGKGMVAFDTTVEGKIKIAYDNAEQTHVIIYLQDKSGSSSAPKRVANAKQEAPGAAIKSIKITPKGAPTAIENVQTSADKGMKYIQAGQMLILRGDKVYTVTGQEVK
jgi:hypothetical protein